MKDFFTKEDAEHRDVHALEVYAPTDRNCMIRRYVKPRGENLFSIERANEIIKHKSWQYDMTCDVGTGAGWTSIGKPTHRWTVLDVQELAPDSWPEVVADFMKLCYRNPDEATQIMDRAKKLMGKK